MLVGHPTMIIFMAASHKWQTRMSWDHFQEQRGKIVEVSGKSISQNKSTPPLTTSAILIFIKSSQIQQVPGQWGKAFRCNFSKPNILLSYEAIHPYFLFYNNFRLSIRPGSSGRDTFSAFLPVLCSLLSSFLTFLPMCHLLFGTPGHSCSCSCLEWCARSGIYCEEEGRRTRFGIPPSVRLAGCRFRTGNARCSCNN